MLYHLFQYLDNNYDLPGTGLFNYITFRAGFAVIISLVIAIFFGKRIIKKLQKMQVGESIRDLGLEGQLEKTGTPTMGGVIIVLAIVVPCLLVADLTNVYILLLLFSTIWMAIIGFVDDYIKVFKKNKDGLSGKFKIIGQVVLGLIVGLVMLFSDDVVVRLSPQEAELGKYEIVKRVTHTTAEVSNEYVYVKTNLTNVPFIKGNNLDYSKILSFLGDNTTILSNILFVFICIFIVTAISNAANLTDGIDGLAAGISAIIGVTLAILAYVSSHYIFAEYLNILYIPYSGELVIFVSCFVGATMGFLWYNGFPAQVFMGDTGSLSIGGIIATLAIVLRKELLLPLLCGIFVAETLSVILQVGYFKYTKRKTGIGKRLILMSPLHHHYQKKGIPESKIVLRFWLVGIVLAVLTIITLKVR